MGHVVLGASSMTPDLATRAQELRERVTQSAQEQYFDMAIIRDLADLVCELAERIELPSEILSSDKIGKLKP